MLCISRIQILYPPLALRCAVHQYNFPSSFLSGYFNGKRRAESAALTAFPESATILQPGMIYGTRHLPNSNASIPLGLVGAPLESIFNVLSPLSGLPVIGHLLAPPIHVDVLAKAAVNAANPASNINGILDVAHISQAAA